MNKIFCRIIAGILVLNHVLLVAAPVNVPRENVVEHLNTQLSDFRTFYHEEQNWLEHKLLPLVNELVTTKKLLDQYDNEVKQWGTLEDISRTRSVPMKIRATRMLRDVEDAGIYLYIAELNLRAGVKKHLDSLDEIYQFTGQVGARYEDLTVKLKLILALFDKEAKSEALLQQASQLQQKLAERAQKLLNIKEQRFGEEVFRINLLLSSAQRHKSRTLWLAALRTYHSLLEDNTYVSMHGLELEKLYEKILASEVSIQIAKNTFRERLENFSDNSTEISPEAISFFQHFFLDPAPRMKAFLRAEEFIAEAMSRSEQSSYKIQSSGIFLISTGGTKSSTKGERKSSTGKSSPRALPKINNDHDADETSHEIITHEVFSSDTSKRSTLGRLVDKALDVGFHAADAIRDALGIRNQENGFDSHNLPEGETTGGPSGEFSNGIGGEPADLPSPTDQSRVKSTVTETRSKNTRTIETRMGDPLSPKDYNQDRQSLYSPQSLIDRADTHNGMRDFGAKTGSFDADISARSQNVSSEIRAGETALQSAFVGLIDKLRSEMNEQNRAFPEATTHVADSIDPQSVRNSIAKAKSVIVILKEKLASSHDPKAAQIENGLDSANILLDTASSALDAGDADTAKAIMDVALDLVAQYGGDVLRLGLGFTPAGDVIDVVELLSGKDAFSGEEIGMGGRIFAGLGVIAGNRAFWDKVASHLPSSLGKDAINAAKEQFENAEKALAANKAAGKSSAVLGKVNTYEVLAEFNGATHLRVPEEVWENLSPAQRWDMNQAFLDRLRRQQKDIVLSNDARNLSPTDRSAFAREIRYLEGKGYKLSKDGVRMELIR